MDNKDPVIFARHLLQDAFSTSVNYLTFGTAGKTRPNLN